MWYHKPGVPPKPEFKSKLYDDCIRLADQWRGLSSASSYQPSEVDIGGWTVGQLLVFMDRLMENPDPIPQPYVTHLGSLYGLEKSKNFEVLSRYLRIALKAGDRRAVKLTREVLGQTGRMKFVRPL